MTNRLTEEEVLDRAVEVLDSLNERKSNTVWVIKYNNKILKLRSGKSSWRLKNHANSALTNALYGYYNRYRNGWEPGEVTKLLQEKGIITIEELK